MGCIHSKSCGNCEYYDCINSDGICTMYEVDDYVIETESGKYEDSDGNPVQYDDYKEEWVPVNDYDDDDDDDDDD